MGGPLGPRDEAGEKAEQDGLVLIVSCEPIALLFCPAVINFEAFGYYHVILWHSWVSCLAFCLFWGGIWKGLGKAAKLDNPHQAANQLLFSTMKARGWNQTVRFWDTADSSPLQSSPPWNCFSAFVLTMPLLPLPFLFRATPHPGCALPFPIPAPHCNLGMAQGTSKCVVRLQ